MWAVMWAVGGVRNFISDLNALHGTVVEPRTRTPDLLIAI
jgi:hypothetical protein